MQRRLLHALCVLLPCSPLLPPAYAQAAEAPAAATTPSSPAAPSSPAFPAHHSDQRISGELVSIDFIRRIGQFRATKTGNVVEFTLPPYGTAQYLNSEASLRDLPLGTFFLFFLNQDTQGGWTRLATMQDQYTMDASHSFTYRLDEVKLAENKLLTTKHSISKKQEDLGKKELLLSPATRYWRGADQIRPEDLKPGEELLYTLTGKTSSNPGVCTDIWAGVETHAQATKQMREKFDAFTKHRGLPGWVDKTEGSTVTVTFFSGDAKLYQTLYGDALAQGKGGNLCVANQDLRTWNPGVDKDGCSIISSEKIPPDGYGNSGIRATFKVSNMLEGFRKGRVVRFFGSGWPTKDQFYGESLMGYGFGRLQTPELDENPAKEYPDQFPFRTDFGNEHLPWYQIKPGIAPPPFAQHVVLGELTKVDAATRTGQFKTDRTGELMDFSLLPQNLGAVKYLNTDATLGDVPVGTRCRFHLFQDEQGKFTKASLVTDEFTRLATNAMTYRVESIQPTPNSSDPSSVTVNVSWQIPEVKNYNGDMERPPDIGRSLIRLNKDTKVWKGKLETPAALKDLAVGDALIINLTGDFANAPAVCTEVWVGTDLHKALAEAQKNKAKLAAGKNAIPAPNK
ncbi:hypothetical protein [Verrucomicrobium sp. BvORR034]|uniref:hypothetical protein n=1 Tax=Verrucomicrobium sp. BvORR034 TaxID=1396418 RepID=UPI0006796D1D|nr:hypothetical protein [Verrucomicrobium sp. BvORR034]